MMRVKKVADMREHVKKLDRNLQDFIREGS